MLSYVANRGDRLNLSGVIASAPAFAAAFPLNPVLTGVGRVLAAVPGVKHLRVPSDIRKLFFFFLPFFFSFKGKFLTIFLPVISLPWNFPRPCCRQSL